MASFFIIGEKKTRPGVYYRYENYGRPPLAGVADGVCAAVIRSDWGILNKPILIESFQDINKYFSDDEESTTEAIKQMFLGGARGVYAVRVGTGGTCGELELKDTGSYEAPVIKLSLLSPGNKTFNVTIREPLGDDSAKELLFSEGTTVLERIKFDKSEDEVQSILDAYAEQGSNFFDLVKIDEGNKKLALIEQYPVTGGTPPTIDADAYSLALNALEPFKWNVIAIDSNDTSIHALLNAYINRIYNDGKFVIGVVGEPTSVSYETRLQNAAAFNDYKMVYVGSGFMDSSGNKFDGYLAAARVAGMIAGTPSNESVTHLTISGAVKLTEYLSNNQYEQAINKGCLTFSESPFGTNWIESGINTLVVPGSKEDFGWKKIKRVKVRFELMQRINDTVEILIGRINNDPDGRAAIIQSAQGVLNSMIAERKLLAGASIELDPNNPPQGDSAWFMVYADDVDALEKMYFAFRFRFAPEE